MGVEEILYHIENLKIIWNNNPNQYDMDIADSLLGTLWKMYTEESDKEK